MAHEELKKLYEIDKQHSETPWQWWEFEVSDRVWGKSSGEPIWGCHNVYRRNPLAPVWDDPFADMLYQSKRSIVEEDARKWRELEAYLPTSKNAQAVVEKISQLRSPALIQGYTAKQWQRIIDGKFLCEFADDFTKSGNSFPISTISSISYGEKFPFMTTISGASSGWPLCRPLRIKGVRQPWFGGECPVDPDAEVLARSLDDGQAWYKGAARNVLWNQTLEFIEL